MPTIRHRGWLGLVTLFAAASPALAQDAVVLAEENKVGDCFRVELGLNLEGKMKVERDGKIEPSALRATATHAFLERVESLDSRGGIGNALRFYTLAVSDSQVDVERSKRELSAERKLIVAKRTLSGPLHFCPDGNLTREELELVAEHFDTMALSGLLPGKETKLGETWAIAADTAQQICLFEGLIKNELTGRLVSVKDGLAEFEIVGKAEGTEHGAHARLAVTAKGKFHLASKRITELSWEQYDDRATGPASPATEVKAKVTLKRTLLVEEPKELSAEVRARIPNDDKVTRGLTNLRYADADGRYRFAYARDWHVVGRTRDHLVLRLLEGGEFAAQATITAWNKAEPGKHATPEEFKAIIARMPGWEPERVVADGEIPASGRWMYRVVAVGKQDGLSVVQSFFLTASPAGEQLAVTVVMRKEKADRAAGRDTALVQAIELPRGK